jgi:hypothetical protein
MNEVIKKKHHYVWKHYLKPWTVNEQICCLRQGKRFSSSLENIAQKRFFYKSIPLNEIELKFIGSFLNQAHPTAKKTLLGLLDVYLKSAYTNEYTQKSGLEDFYSIVEGNFIPILDKIYKNDFSFLDDLKERNDFSFFIGIQYMRTHKMRDNFNNLSLINVPKDLNKDNLGKIFSLFFADIIGNWFFQVGRLNLLHNESDFDFITGDQPIFNKKGHIKVNGNVKEFDLYFPITPKLAIQISDYKEGEEFLDKDSVINYNKMIKSNSKEQIFSKQMSDFDLYIDN